MDFLQHGCDEVIGGIQDADAQDVASFVGFSGGKGARDFEEETEVVGSWFESEVGAGGVPDLE
jgi:hypothetical protein